MIKENAKNVVNNDHSEVIDSGEGEAVPLNAEALFRKALQLWPHSASAKINLATLLKEHSRFSDCAQVCANGLWAFPDHALLHSVWATCTTLALEESKTEDKRIKASPRRSHKDETGMHAPVSLDSLDEGPATNHNNSRPSSPASPKRIEKENRVHVPWCSACYSTFDVDRQIRNASSVVVEVLGDPPIYHIQNLLTSDEAVHILDKLRTKLFKPSAITNFNSPSRVDASRTSSSAFFTEDDLMKDPVLLAVASRMDHIVSAPLSPLSQHFKRFNPKKESLQVTSYGPGQFYKPHLDLDDDIEGSPRRRATFILYLNDIPMSFGGATVFPFIELLDTSSHSESARNTVRVNMGKHRCEGSDSGTLEISRAVPSAESASSHFGFCDCGSTLKFYPRRGEGLVFFPALPSNKMDPRVLHAACPIASNNAAIEFNHTKWIFQQWYAP